MHPSLPILNALTAHIALLDPEGTLVAVNDAWTHFAQANGDSPLAAAGVGVNYLAVCHAAISAKHPEAAEVAAGIADVLAGRRDMFSLEYPCHLPYEQRWFQLHVAPISDNTGVIIVSVLDITARKQAEEALHESEARYHLLFENNLDAVFLTSPDGQILDANPAACAMLGYTIEELRHLGRAGVVDSTDPRLPQLLEDRTRTGRLMGELTLIRRDGSRFPAEIESTIFRDQHGALRTSMIARDITARKQAEAALRASEERYRGLVEHASDGIFIADSAGKYLDVNTSGCAMLGYTRAEILDRSMRDLVSRDELAANPLRMDELQAGRVVRNERTMRRKDGTLLPVEISARILPDGRLQGIVRDITERKRAEQALAQERASLAQRVEERTADLRVANADLTRALRLKDEFMAMMSHELRTPLNTILGMTEALQEQIYGSLTAKQHHALDNVAASGQHLLALINDILDLAKIEAGQVSLNVEQVEVGPICEATVRMIRQTAEARQLTITMGGDPAVKSIYADELRVKQVLINLLTNAVKFTPAGGNVGIEVAGDDDLRCVRFTVWDTGIGIAEDDVGLLFQPFVQLDSRLARAYEGTGLGLALVARLTKLHGGSVTVTSKLGQGSRFTVTLPWQPPALR